MPHQDDPRFDLVFETELLQKNPRPRRPHGAFPSFLGKLNALRERGGVVLGDAYALAAKSFLERWEGFEDRAAERRFRQSRRSSTSAAVKSATPRLKLSPPAK